MWYLPGLRLILQQRVRGRHCLHRASGRPESPVSDRKQTAPTSCQYGQFKPSPDHQVGQHAVSVREWPPLELLVCSHKERFHLYMIFHKVSGCEERKHMFRGSSMYKCNRDTKCIDDPRTKCQAVLKSTTGGCTNIWNKRLSLYDSYKTKGLLLAQTVNVQYVCSYHFFNARLH